MENNVSNSNNNTSTNKTEDKGPPPVRFMYFSDPSCPQRVLTVSRRRHLNGFLVSWSQNRVIQRICNTSYFKRSDVLIQDPFDKTKARAIARGRIEKFDERPDMAIYVPCEKDDNVARTLLMALVESDWPFIHRTARRTAKRLLVRHAQGALDTYRSTKYAMSFNTASAAN